MITIRPIEPADNPSVAHVITTVLSEFGVCGEGFSIVDAEVAAMCEAYTTPRAAYYVAVDESGILGGCGIGPLAGGPVDVCELRKFFLLPTGRGKGAGARLLNQSLAAARSFGFTTCYLETLPAMRAAAQLYVRRGFVPLQAPMGNTGHFGCSRWYAVRL